MIIANGTVITASNTYKTNIAIKEGKIAMIGHGLKVSGVEVVYASGKFVLPGVINAHTHLQMPFGGTVSSNSSRKPVGEWLY